MCYDYSALMSDITRICARYGFIGKRTIGQSVMGRDIPCLCIGSGAKKIMLGGAYHGLEYLTAAFLMEFLKDYAKHYDGSESFFGADAREVYNKVSLYIVPMVNIDGVDIAVNGLELANPFHRRLIGLAGICDFTKEWQANVNGVDLNHNYDANWCRVVDRPAPSKYGGAAPESEPETKAVADLIRSEGFDILIAFHSQGGEIYYDFDGRTGMGGREIADKMAKVSGYTVCTPHGTAAYGGCKDWFIKEFGKNGFTIEIGRGKNPLPLSMLDEIYEENARIILCAMTEV